jgi:hypothetical protein
MSERETMAGIDERPTMAEDGVEVSGSTDIEADHLFPEDRASTYRKDWDQIQVRFVDDPHGAVEKADELVSAVIGELESSFRSRRDRLESSWQRGDETSTEDLRVALQSYRAFFGRLLGA